MNNPLSILRLMAHSKRPSSVGVMRAVKDAFWLRPHYAALTFFGHIVTATQQEADELNRGYSTMVHHEQIHLRQAQACHDSWLLFYLRYGWYYLKALPWNRRMRNAAYRLNPFEMEAYLHDHDLHYLDDKADGTWQWREFARMGFQQRLDTYQQQRIPI